MSAISRQKPKPKPTPTYSWIMSGNYVYCYRSPWGGQDVAKLWEVEAAAQTADFHDEQLANATKEINAILSKVEKSNSDRTRKLSFIQHGSRYLLVWAKYADASAYDDRETIAKALRLKTR